MEVNLKRILVLFLTLIWLQIGLTLSTTKISREKRENDQNSVMEVSFTYHCDKDEDCDTGKCILIGQPCEENEVEFLDIATNMQCVNRIRTCAQCTQDDHCGSDQYCYKNSCRYLPRTENPKELSMHRVKIPEQCSSNDDCLCMSLINNQCVAMKCLEKTCNRSEKVTNSSTTKKPFETDQIKASKNDSCENYKQDNYRCVEKDICNDFYGYSDEEFEFDLRTSSNQSNVLTFLNCPSQQICCRLPPEVEDSKESESDICQLTFNPQTQLFEPNGYCNLKQLQLIDGKIETIPPFEEFTTTTTTTTEATTIGKYGKYKDLTDLLLHGTIKEIDAILYPPNKVKKGHGKCTVRFDSKTGQYVSSNCPTYLG